VPLHGAGQRQHSPAAVAEQVRRHLGARLGREHRGRRHRDLLLLRRRRPGNRRLPRAGHRVPVRQPRGLQPHLGAAEFLVEHGALADRRPAREPRGVACDRGHVVQRPPRHPCAPRRHLVRYERRHPESEQRPAPWRGGPQLVRHVRRHEHRLHAPVQAPRALQAGDVPVVDDLGLRLRHGEHDDPGIRDFEGPDQPLGVRDPGGEPPPAGDGVSARDGRADAARRQLPGDHRQRRAAGEDPVGRGEPAAREPAAAGPDHGRPRHRRVRVRQFLDHVAELQRVQRRPAQLGRGLQPEEPQVREQGGGRRRQRP
jgi:hypothetical protein